MAEDASKPPGAGTNAKFDAPTKDPTVPARPAAPSHGGDSVSLPIVDDVNMKLGFGHLDSDYFIQEVTLNIDVTERVARATYAQVVDISTTDPPINEEDFIRVWKTILLVRSMHVFESEKGVRPPHYIRLAPTVSLPRPLGDLVYSLGQFHSMANGIVYDIVPPVQGHAPEPWWQVNGGTLTVLFYSQILQYSLSPV